MTDAAINWSHAIYEDPDGTCRVEVVGEDGVPWPVARQLTRGQADKLIDKIAAESVQSGKPVKVVIRDPYFMAATVITLKRQPI
ncbi:MAG TPA: hypothetical protein VGQ62_17145 [Chloroflexota bacterium]|jgi:hypothetical protein|nr:hypothetical protein [Chloroflexota bacterium]